MIWKCICDLFFNNKVYLQNLKDKAVKFIPRLSDEERLQQSSNRAVVIYRFSDRPGQPQLTNPLDWQLVYITPARLVRATVPFEFRKIPLP